MIDLLAPLLLSVGLGEHRTESAITTLLELLLGLLEVERIWFLGGGAIKVQLRRQLLERVVFLDDSAGLLGLSRPDRFKPLPQHPLRLCAEVLRQRKHRLKACWTEVLHWQPRRGSLEQDLEAIGGLGGLP